VVVRVLDPAEAELGFHGNVRLRALEGGAVVEADADLVREGYKERLAALAAPWASELEARGGRLLEATSATRRSSSCGRSCARWRRRGDELPHAGRAGIALLVAAPVAAHMLRRRMAEERAFPPARLVPPTLPAARRRSMLEDRALFALRALAVLGLALLGATPFIRCSRLSLNRKDGASVALAIVVDDSLSMRAPLDGGPAGPGKKTRFDRALEAARELGATLGRGTRRRSSSRVAAARGARVDHEHRRGDGHARRRRALGSRDGSRRSGGARQGALARARAARQAGRGAERSRRRRAGRAPLAGDAEIAVWAPLPELEARGRDCAVTRADRAGNKVWARVICTDVGSAQGSASAAPSASAASGPSAGRSLEIRSGAKVIASVALGSGIHTEEVPIELPANAPELLVAALTGDDAIAEDDQAPVVSSGGALPTAVIVDAALTHVATGGPPPIEQAFAALKLDAQIHPLPAVPEHDAELNAYAALIVDDAPGFTPEVRRSIAAWVERGGVALLTLGPRAAAAPLGAGFEPLVPGVVRWGASPAPGIDPASAPTLGPSAEGLAALDPRGRVTLDAAAAEGAEILARWNDGAPFLTRRSLGRGAVLALTLPLSSDESDLVLRPAFLALLDRFVSTARARGGARRIDVGEAWTFDGYRKVEVRKVSIAAPERPTPVPVIEVDRRPRANPPRAGLYELTLDGESVTRVAAVPDREIDLRPRQVKDEARASALGGVATSLDASPYVALGLLGLLAIELVLRALGQRSERVDEESAATR
jgi:hypothetical protein